MKTSVTASPLAALRDLLRRPAKFGLVLNASLLAIWYGTAYSPLHRAIDQDGREVATQRERLALARDIEHLRRQVDRYGANLPEAEDGDAWVHFLMGGVRQFPVKLVSLEPRPPADVGPYRAAVFRVIVEGPYPELERFLRWLEGSPRLIRVDSIRIATKSTAGVANPAATTNEMQLLLMGIDA